jgi:FkbM family methyltransferase
MAIIFFAVIVIPILSVFAMAPYSPRMRTTALSMARTVRAATLLRRRDQRCSLADVWTVTSGHLVRERERIQNLNKVVARDGDLLLVATSAGKFWIPASDQYALAGELAEQEEGVHGNQVHTGDIVLDCGANVGVYTRAALAQGAKVVVAIDLAPEPLACLRRTFEHEIQEGRVIVYPKGVWDRDTTLRLSVNTASTDDSVALNRGEQGPEVPLTTIDRLVSELKLPRVDFIEMDIEGAESHALQGAAHTIAVYKPRLAISMEHKQSDPEEIPALIRRLNGQYQMRCGVCGYTTGRVQPEEIFAW